MNKAVALFNLVVSTIIAAIVLYVLSLFFVFIALCILSIFYALYKKFKPVPEWTKWVYIENAYPKISYDENGVMYFQSVRKYKRFNNKTQTWHFKTETDPIKRRPKEATCLQDMFYLKRLVH